MKNRIILIGALTVAILAIWFAMAFCQPDSTAVSKPGTESGNLVYYLTSLVLGSGAVYWLTNKFKNIPLLSGVGTVVSSGILGVACAFLTNLIFKAHLDLSYVLLLGLGGNQTTAQFIFHLVKGLKKPAA